MNRALVQHCSNSETMSEIEGAHVTIVQGDDEFLTASAVRRVRDSLHERVPDRDIMTLDADTATRFDFDQAVGPSLFSDSAIVIIEHMERADDDLGQAITQFMHDSYGDPQAAYVIMSHDGSTHGRTTIDRLFTAGAIREDVSAPKRPQDIVEYVRQQFANHSRHVAPDAANQLAGTLGSSLRELSGLIDQLCDDFDDDPITLGRVNQYLIASPQVKGWDIADTAINGRTGQAVIMLRSALEQGTEPLLLIGAFASRIRAIATVMDANSAAQAHMRDWQYKKTKTMARGWTSRGIAACMESLAHADEQCKTSNTDTAYALEQCVELMAARGHTR